MYMAAAIQMISEPGLKEANINRGMDLLDEAVTKGADLIVFPELWTTGYYLSKEEFKGLAERRDGRTTTLMQEKARSAKKVIISTFPELDPRDNEVFITSCIIDTDGTIKGFHRKSLLWGRERDIFKHGKINFPVYDTSLGRIAVLICYELEFPEPSRLLAKRGVDLIAAPSVWSMEAAERWEIQLRARALDNLLYVLGVNNVDNNACGKSKLVNPWGTVVSEASGEKETVLLGKVEKDKIGLARSKIPYYEDFNNRLQFLYSNNNF
ncbi:MAG: nitrilase, partial [Clostridia bacterium]|nr:nitrilase [Clostridia bacterium]